MKEFEYRRQQRQRKEQQQQTNPLIFAVQLGFFAGLIWGCMRWMSAAMKFTIVVPGFLVEPFYKHDYLLTWKGGVVGLVSFIGFSILASILYTALFKKFIGPWGGMIYGIVWWLILFVFIGPMIGLMPPITKTTWNTIWTESCLFLLWGLFIGYTVAMEFNDERLREPDNDSNGSNMNKKHQPNPST
ncbi:YqhR family membrane protein [Paenibacillus sp. 1001270B_150601_E10]|uniref:YqhR family membrane protein n=1 Tax=Paenibacillus sp. 1001270B_150601_E10 TaxID=2787079 RepID=UPI00189D0345|nr:YqhR family membrane protein [Paenibacillus sp. 1001270B_150601_E10]